ncbi:MAG: TrkA family potassium uptake protein [Mycoplasma sp.]
MNKSDYFIIGYGKFGRRVAKTLIEKGNNVVIIDANKEIVDKVDANISYAMCVDATDIDALKETGVINAKCVIVAMSSVQESILTCANLVELGAKGNIIARAQNGMHKRVLKTIGIEHISVPEEEVAHRVALQAMYHFGESIHSLTEGFVWLRLIVSNHKCIAKPVQELNIRENVGASILFIKKNGEVVFPILADTQLALGDVVYILTSEKMLSKTIDFFTDPMFRAVNSSEETKENKPLAPRVKFKKHLKKINKITKKTKKAK